MLCLIFSNDKVCSFELLAIFDNTRTGSVAGGFIDHLARDGYP